MCVEGWGGVTKNENMNIKYITTNLTTTNLKDEGVGGCVCVLG